MAELPPMPRGEELTTHGRFLRALARSLVAPADQEDLVQEAWTRALAHPPRHDSALKAWLARILRRTAHAQGGREAERGEREATAFLARPERASDDPAAIAAELELSRRVLESVERLREPYRSTLYLRYYRGHAPERIAAESGTPLKTVKTRLARGLEELRGELDRLHCGERQAWVALLLPLTRGTPAEPLETLPPVRVGPGVLVAGGALLLAGSAAVVLFLLEGGAEPRPGTEPDSPPLAAPSDPSEREPEPAASARVSLTTDSESMPARDDRIRLRGRTLDALGEALAGVEVRVTPLAREFRGLRGPELDPAGEPELAATTSAADGGFELVLDAAGPIRVGCERDGCAALGRRLLVFAGQELDLGALVLEPGARLAGRVRDEHGRALAGAELWMPRRDEGLRFGPEESWFLVGRSDARGEFTLARLAAGDWRLEARMEDHRSAAASGTSALDGAPAEPLELVLTRGAALAGTVLGLAAEELATARVLARPAAGGAPRLATPDAGGRFRFGGLAPEEELELVLLRGEARESRRGAASLRARAGEEGLVLVADPPDADPRRMRASPGLAGAERGSLLATVTTEDGQPRPGALVLLLTPASGREDSEVRAADRDGRVFFDELAPGEHGLAVVSGVFDPRLESAAGACFVSVATGETTHTTLRALSLGRLAGEVRVQGRTLAGAEVRVRPIGNDDARRGPSPSLVAKSDGEGRFSFVELPPGSYALELAHRSLAAPHRRTLELRAGANELRLALATGEFAARVLDEGGRPLAGVRVLAAATSERSWPAPDPLPLATSDARGEFVLAGIDFDAPPELTLEAEGRASLRLVPAPGAPSEYRLEPEAALALTLTGTRAPWLRLVARGPDGAERVLGLPSGRRVPLHGLAPGRWSFTLHAPERARTPTPIFERTLELVAGEPLELDIELP